MPRGLALGFGKYTVKGVVLKRTGARYFKSCLQLRSCECAIKLGPPAPDAGCVAEISEDVRTALGEH